MSKSYELLPVDSHKSFYGKAFVTVQDDGTEILMSYNTPVIMRSPSGKLFRIWPDWSATTGRHIKSFCGLNKAEFVKLPYYDEDKRPETISA